MADPKLIKTPDMGEVQAKDFVERFSESITKLTQALSTTRPQAMTQGNTIQMYKFTTDMAATTAVGEGEDIPLSGVKRVKDRAFTVGFEKARKAVSIEEVQRVGYDMAVLQSDKRILKEIQKNVRKSFFDFLATAPTDLKAQGGLQNAIAQSVGKLQVLFDDDAVETIVFINPMDAAKYLGAADITNGASVGFGLTLLNSFLGGVTLIMNSSVPENTFYATVKDNINLMYLDTNGESRKLFENKSITTDETGLIALVRDDNTTNLTNQSTLYWGIKIFPEVANGVIKGTFAAPATDETGKNDPSTGTEDKRK